MEVHRQWPEASFGDAGGGLSGWQVALHGVELHPKPPVPLKGGKPLAHLLGQLVPQGWPWHPSGSRAGASSLERGVEASQPLAKGAFRLRMEIILG